MNLRKMLLISLCLVALVGQTSGDDGSDAAAVSQAQAEATLRDLMLKMEERMLFAPFRKIHATPAALKLDFEDLTLKSTDKVTINAWFVPAKKASQTILYCHGNGGNLSNYLGPIASFHSMGCNVLALDYRGYGKSSGTPSEKGFYDDAKTAWTYLVETRKIPPEQIIVVGWSLGGAVAAQLASTQKPGGLILESSFTQVRDMARVRMPFIPEGAAILDEVRNEFATLEYVTRIHCPLLVIHSSQDRMVPFAQGQAIFKAAPDPKTFLKVTGSHNGGCVNDPKYFPGIRTFLESVRLPKK